MITSSTNVQRSRNTTKNVLVLVLFFLLVVIVYHMGTVQGQFFRVQVGEGGEYLFRKNTKYAQDRTSRHARREQRKLDREQRRQQRHERWNERWNYFDDDKNSTNSSTFNFTEIIKSYQIVIPLEAPRDVFRGIFLGIKSVAVGLTFGLSCFAILPLALSTLSEFSKEKGIAIGLSLGGIAAGGSIATSVALGIGQITVGILNTPGAMYASWVEKKCWDSNQFEWIRCSLQEEIDEICNSTNNQIQVTDLAYYEWLGVAQSASSKEIKRGYHTKAKEVHPDKNPGDERAAEQFVQLHMAYQTLIDLDKRDAYDKYGRSSKSSSNNGDDGLFNVDVFFEILFGSQVVESYVGQLTVSSFFGQLLKISRVGSASNFTSETLQLFRQTSQIQERQRTLNAAIHLRDKIQPMVNQTISVHMFRESCEKEAELISETGFGNEFLLLIGRTIISEADLLIQKTLFGWPRWLILKTKKLQHHVHRKIEVARMTGRLFSDVYAGSQNWTNHHQNNSLGTFVQDRVDAKSDKHTNNKNKIPAKVIETLLPQILEIAWAYNAGDIEQLLEHAIYKVYHDDVTNLHVINPKASNNERLQRLKLLRILGEIFVERGLRTVRDVDSCSMKNKASVFSEDSVARARLEVAYRVAQLQGDRPSSEESERMIQRAKQEFF